MGSMCLRVADDAENEDLGEQDYRYIALCILPNDLKTGGGSMDSAMMRDGPLSSPMKSQLSKPSRESDVLRSDISTTDLSNPEPQARELQVTVGRRPSRMPAQNRRQWDPATAVPVELHVYDIGTSGRGSCINRFLRPLGTGAFHCGVEVYSCEWSFSDTTSRKEQTGVFRSTPRQCKGHTYCESVLMGRTSCSETEVMAILDMLKQDWQVTDYDLLRRNCCHFADELCWRLGVGAIPTWVTNLAAGAASVEEAGERFGKRAKDACTCSLCCTAADSGRNIMGVEPVLLD